MIYWTWAFAGLSIRVGTGIQDMRFVGEGVHTKGRRQWDVVKRRMERRVRREIGQVLQVGLDPGDGLEIRVGLQGD